MAGTISKRKEEVVVNLKDNEMRIILSALKQSEDEVFRSAKVFVEDEETCERFKNTMLQIKELAKKLEKEWTEIVTLQS